MALPRIDYHDDPEFNIVDEEGVHHDGIEGWCASFLGFCGCGRPEDPLETVLGVLSAFEAMRAARDVKDDATANMAWEQIHRIAPTEGEYAGLGYSLLYMLDDKGLIDHGSSVHGSWLTDDGKEFLARLRKWKSGPTY